MTRSWKKLICISIGEVPFVRSIERNVSHTLLFLMKLNGIIFVGCSYFGYTSLISDFVLINRPLRTVGCAATETALPGLSKIVPNPFFELKYQLINQSRPNNLNFEKLTNELLRQMPRKWTRHRRRPEPYFRCASRVIYLIPEWLPLFQFPRFPLTTTDFGPPT